MFLIYRLLENGMLKIDLGCGANKAEGFIGVDRFSLPGVDVVHDLDKPLPFETNSADLIYASHSLEHIPNLIGTLAEIYRILRHGGQLCIVAPYSEQKLNTANPYHVAAFNEHTPRFWTNHPTAGVDPVEYAHPHAGDWGLAGSDHSTSIMDFRLVDMEFFYFPQFLGYSEDERRTLRQHRIDVCDQIMYHLIAWKPEDELSDGDYEKLLDSFQPYVPDYVIARRATDIKKANLVPAAQLPQYLQRIASLQAEIEVSDALIAEYSRQNEELKTFISRLEYRQEHVSLKLSSVYNELSLYRDSRPQRFASYLRRDRLWDDISPTFQDLKRYSHSHLRRFGFHLALSRDLRLVDYFEYRMPMTVTNVTQISLGINPIGITAGTVGIEIVSVDGAIVAQSLVGLNQVSSECPTVFSLTAPCTLAKGWCLRVFVQNATAPVAVYELVNPSIWRRQSMFRAFASVK